MCLCLRMELPKVQVMIDGASAWAAKDRKLPGAKRVAYSGLRLVAGSPRPGRSWPPALGTNRKPARAQTVVVWKALDEFQIPGARSNYYLSGLLLEV